MDETALRNLLDSAVADEPPIRPVGDKVLRAGIRLRRRRQAALAAIPVLAAVPVTAVALATTAAPGLPAGISPARPAAEVPHQFSPFIAYAALGWLPAGYKLLEGGTTRGSTYQVS